MKKAIALRVMGPVLLMGAFLAAPTSAFAAGTDPTSTAVEGQFTDITSQITTVYIPALLALVAVGIGLMVGLKYLRKGAGKV